VTNVGDPRKPRKSYRRPRRIWTTDLLNSELYILGSYGLRNKRELWKAQTEVARFRNQARALLALPTEQRTEKESRLVKSLQRLDLVKESSTLDDVLNLRIEDLLDRRLQTLVMKKGGTKSPHQARQAVVHGLVSIGDRIVNVPGYIVRKEEEVLMAIRPDIVNRFRGPQSSGT
jgi:small subunit ribosomal protein S4